MMNGVGKAMVGIWRAHTSLDESDDAESSPEAPDRFRKLRSSSSLNSLRMSLRKRLPLRSVQASSLPENPTWETLQPQPKTNTINKFTRSARHSIGGVYQRLQRSKESVREECLVTTPGQICEEEEEEECASTSRTPKPTVLVAMATPRRTPRSATTPRRTPGSRRRSGVKGTPEADADVRRVKTGGGRRQLVRMAALRSPFASPNTQGQRQKFDRDLESVSSGMRKLKHLSRAFDDVIGRDDGSLKSLNFHPQRSKCWSTLEIAPFVLRTRRVERGGEGAMMMRRLDPGGKLSRSSLARRATNLSHSLGGWVHAAAGSLRKPN